jgi:GNAT superfamily N-acetyltransferase
MSAFTIRPAIAADARAIAEIHYAGWQIAYSRVVSDAQMAAKLPERRIPFWQAHIADPTCVVLIAHDEAGRAQGFVYAGDVLEHDIRAGSLAGFDCEIYSLHCRKDVQSRGLGRLLMAETARAFQERARTALMLWAYRDNSYRRFYEKIGGDLVAEGFDDDVPDVAYGWRLTSLAAANARGLAG